MRHLVLLGGGYGNMRVLLRLLPNHLPDDVTITLVDKVPYHCLKTEYYALAAGTASDHEVRVSFPEHEKLNIIYDEITAIHLDRKEVELKAKGALAYDDLVIGLGCEDKYHGVPGAEEYTYSIQSIQKSRATYEKLNNMPAGSKVGIVGAGLSGIELASELRESRPDLDIKLFDRGPRILKDFPQRLSRYIEKWFTDHGVEVVRDANITRVEPDRIYNREDEYKMDAVVWTAGIQPSLVVRQMNVEKDRSDRVVLTPHHNLPGNEHVYVVGDCASLPHAPSAQLAEEQAEQIVDVLQKRWRNEPLPEKLPEMKLKGVLGSLGKKQGFGFVADRAITGRVARFLKSGVLWMYKYHNG
ncbi:NAD(P)/FAD-dependent oxidoreductase [Domibacillus sp. DTU_2020_1001157_1_SI_ALB_TIR_016]|uniref:NAD(P)/FAD-dependent oxidoreductase n=1 Tax=Domibacillus sp. DTU_2020_1001157_1_SI_ALB_TIR_016 TaxID=3077789 RepID=UPI0028EA4BD0|nr:NAD(P)/FAD-dependent oxidoreductase [Domibacillus sp. DTU_2020_1001157_1_SI_ALB_TIR_016]WNS81617.1 NAD(P)/FAD-dependent oxidoreductase [Domibacillus sp. DTU_2020_1001157_1_SI_ALB_TIR_016]